MSNLSSFTTISNDCIISNNSIPKSLVTSRRRNCSESSVRSDVEKAAHATSSKKRRRNITEGFQTLADCVPKMKLTRMTKLETLEGAIDYIRELSESLNDDQMCTVERDDPSSDSRSIQSTCCNHSSLYPSMKQLSPEINEYSRIDCPLYPTSNQTFMNDNVRTSCVQSNERSISSNSIYTAKKIQTIPEHLPIRSDSYPLYPTSSPIFMNDEMRTSCEQSNERSIPSNSIYTAKPIQTIPEHLPIRSDSYPLYPTSTQTFMNDEMRTSCVQSNESSIPTNSLYTAKTIQTIPEHLPVQSDSYPLYPTSTQTFMNNEMRNSCVQRNCYRTEERKISRQENRKSKITSTPQSIQQSVGVPLNEYVQSLPMQRNVPETYKSAILPRQKPKKIRKSKSEPIFTCRESIEVPKIEYVQSLPMQRNVPETYKSAILPPQKPKKIRKSKSEPIFTYRESMEVPKIKYVQVLPIPRYDPNMSVQSTAPNSDTNSNYDWRQDYIAQWRLKFFEDMEKSRANN